MTNPYDKNKANSADEAAKIIPRTEFRIFGKNIITSVPGAWGKAHKALNQAPGLSEWNTSVGVMHRF